MFDIGFGEIVVIAVVALIVIGPEKLPKTARTLGHLFGRLQRYVNEVKSDISREIELDEFRKMQQEVQSAAKSVEQSLTSAVQQVDSGLRGVESQLNAAADDGRHADIPVRMEPLPTESLPMAPLPPPQQQVAAESGDASHGDVAESAPRQTTLPGFDRG